jgi:hypothetical protein
MNTILQYFLIYILCIRPLLSYIQVPPIQFYFYTQIDEVIQGGRKRNIMTYTDMSWYDIYKMIFIFFIYPININIENI